MPKLDETSNERTNRTDPAAADEPRGAAQRSPARPARVPRAVGMTDRGRKIVESTVRLGAATRATLQALHAPEIAPDTFRTRLRTLEQRGYLRQTRHPTLISAHWLYSAGPAALVPGQERPWTPSLNQLEHTIAVGDTLLALLHPGIANGITITDWQGEAELRAWEKPGEPRPDLRVLWQRTKAAEPTAEPAAASTTAGPTVTEDAAPAASPLPKKPAGPAAGWLQVEVDRGTEARAAWRRKLLRYGNAGIYGRGPTPTVLVVTTSDRRARNIATLAVRLTIELLATGPLTIGGSEPYVFHSSSRRLLKLGTVLRGGPQW